jgi:hypothetical protein
MPYSDPEKKKEADRKYRERQKSIIAEQKKLAFEKDRKKLRKKMEARNRAAGHEPRPKGPKSLPEIKVPMVRRWRWLNGRLYFTTLRGFEIEEVVNIVQFVQEELAKANQQKDSRDKKR